MRSYALLLLIGIALACGCTSPDPPIRSKGDKSMSITLTSTAFEAGKPIPKKYAADGEDVSPPLAWTKPPQGTQELALLCDDPDAPSGDWVHWLIYKIPPGTASLPQGVPREKTLKSPAGALQGATSWGASSIGYHGPKPPSGTHHYHFKLYALDAAIDVPPGADKKALLKAIKDHVLVQSDLIGTYQKQ